MRKMCQLILTKSEQQSFVAEKLRDCIRERGYTKVSFAKKAGVTCLELESLLNGNVQNRDSFIRLFDMALSTLNTSLYELCRQRRYFQCNKDSEACQKFQMNDKAKKQYALLLDILDLCEIYY